jgi:AcrR family transcriptional regulator
MYAPPRNKRQRETKQRFYEALIGLVQTKPMSEISASEIADNAGLSRQAFYRYYTDAFDLLCAMQEDLYVGFKQQLQDVPADVFAITPVLIRFAAKNRVLVRVAYENRSSGGFIDQVISHLYDTYHADWQHANPLMSKENVDFLFHYVSAGLLGVIHFWLFRQPDLDIDAVVANANYLMRLSPPGTPPIFLG